MRSRYNFVAGPSRSLRLRWATKARVRFSGAPPQKNLVVCYLLPVATCCRTAAIPAPSITASIMASQPMHELIIMW
jgi:hypothetical protein